MKRKVMSYCMESHNNFHGMLFFATFCLVQVLSPTFSLRRKVYIFFGSAGAPETRPDVFCHQQTISVLEGDTAAVKLGVVRFTSFTTISK